MIEIKNLSKAYGDKKAVDNINLTFNCGEIIGIFGENGAGKTTLIKSVLGLIKHEGTVTVDGEEADYRQMHKLAFATSEHSFFPDLTGNDHKDFYKESFPDFNEKRFRGLMEFFGLPLNKKIKSFSTGQKNQFEVVMALSKGADYIFMDEPFAGNDMFNREDFYKVLLGILKENETVILSTHLIEEVENFISRAILIKDGKIIDECRMEDLEDAGKTLSDYVKESYNYKSERVLAALDKITEGDEEA